MNPELLYQKAKKHQLNGKIFTSVDAAVNNAKKEAHNDDLIFIGGSTFVVAELF
mgnify:FL=1|jgi:dihydrofolate synthase/folylpolyglutamate synthase